MRSIAVEIRILSILRFHVGSRHIHAVNRYPVIPAVNQGIAVSNILDVSSVAKNFSK